MNSSLHRPSLGLLMATILLATGCTSTRISLPTGPVPNYDESRPRHISAQTSGFQLLLFFPIMVNSRYDRAWEQLKLSAGRDYIADVTVQDSWTYGFVGTVYSVRLEANAYPLLGP